MLGAGHLFVCKWLRNKLLTAQAVRGQIKLSNEAVPHIFRGKFAVELKTNLIISDKFDWVEPNNHISLDKT